MKKHIMFLHLLKAIDHTVLLALSYFRYFFLLSTDEYLPHTVLDCKVIDPQATTSSYSLSKLFIATPIYLRMAFKAPYIYFFF